jgi:hypothetical protein
MKEDTMAQPDYPAAHSMDTTWFAVDQAGHVGVFCSGEDGPVSFASSCDDSFADFLRCLGADLPPAEEDDYPDWDALEDEAAELGLFVYSYGDGIGDLVQPYSFTRMPGVPRHVEQIPPLYRPQVRATRFEGVLFPESDNVQPIEHTPAGLLSFYGEGPVAYLAADQKTVRPIPGKEDEFSAFCQHFREIHPEWLTRLTFDEPQTKDEGTGQGHTEG